MLIAAFNGLRIETNQMDKKDPTPCVDPNVTLRKKPVQKEAGVRKVAEMDLPQYVTCRGKRFTIHRRVGKGGFGTVHQVKDISGHKFAMKTLCEQPKFDAVAIKNELNICLQLRHPNIIQFLGYQVDSVRKLHFFLMEYAGHGTLLDFIVQKRACNHWLRRHIFHQLITAVAFIHQSGFVHRDLKAENILFTDPTTVKICDFGLTRFIQKDDMQREVKRKSQSGTVMYFSPLKFKGCPSLATKDDVWALGAVLLMFATGRQLWTSLEQKKQMFSNWLRNPTQREEFYLLSHIDLQAYNLLRQMLHPVEDCRWTIFKSREFISILAGVNSSYVVAQPKTSMSQNRSSCLQHPYRV
ncbi:hypothetical protein QR680_011318 [Steinernema hermaphroditum]|uniref:Protein kinase domain-containing protein n=1 Tax=Steinernema hermaphroditum TaxID=289476 RepID=A0AA39IRV1_9BILA|nr:hypothetical protein QR680_011318 [Steinernema hermaphroditum]